MGYEYLQEKYRTDGKRFHPELNKKATHGWKVESLLPMGEHVLVTYSRLLPQELYFVDCGLGDFEKEISKMKAKGYRLMGVSQGETRQGDFDPMNPDGLEPTVLSVWEYHHLPEKL